MRLIVSLLGRELLSVALESSPCSDTAPSEQGEHDNIASQVERAEPMRLGFVIPANPSTEEVEPA